jgi:hypothetical protein
MDELAKRQFYLPSTVSFAAFFLCFERDSTYSCFIMQMFIIAKNTFRALLFE